jgi:hypothetical protein
MEKESISTVKEITTSLNSALYKRITNPLIGSFILTWLIWNWKLIIYILHLNPMISIQENIEVMQDNYLSNFWVNIFWPIASALFLTLGFPYLNIEITAIVEKARKKLINKRTIIRDEVHPNFDEHIILLEKYRNLKSAISDLEITLRSEQENFEDAKTKLINEIERHKSSIKISEDEYYQEKHKNETLKNSNQELIEKIGVLEKTKQYYFYSLKMRVPSHDFEKFIYSDLGRFFLNIIYYYSYPVSYSDIRRNTSKEIFEKYEQENIIAPLPGKTKIFDPNYTKTVEFFFTEKGWGLIRMFIVNFTRLINIGYRTNLPYPDIKSAQKIFEVLSNKEDGDNLTNYEDLIKGDSFDLKPISNDPITSIPG